MAGTIKWWIWQVIKYTGHPQLWFRVGEGIERPNGGIELKFNFLPRVGRIVLLKALANHQPFTKGGKK